MEKRLNNWKYAHISKGGRLTHLSNPPFLAFLHTTTPNGLISLLQKKKVALADTNFALLRSGFGDTIKSLMLYGGLSLMPNTVNHTPTPFPPLLDSVATKSLKEQ